MRSPLTKLIEMKTEKKYLLLFALLVCCYYFEVFVRGAVLAVGDGLDYFYPMMITMANQYRNMTFPFWNPYMFSGFPLFGSMQPGALYPFNVILPLLFSPALAFNLNLLLHYSLAGFFTFLYARQIGLGLFPSTISGIVFSLLGYLPSHLMHPSIITSGTWIPLLLYFIERIKQNSQLRDALCASLVVALQVFAGHPQVCFYTYLMLVFYMMFNLFGLERSKRRRFALLSFGSLGIGWIIALPQLVSVYQLATMGTRVKTTYQFFSSFAFPLYMMPTFLFPFFYHYGGGYGGEMWGPTPVLGQEAFVGILPFLLSVLVVAFRWRKNRLILFWGIMALLALVLALGDDVRPLNKVLYHLSVYNSFRGPSKHILDLSFALSVLSGFGMTYLREREGRFVRALMITIAAVTAVSLISFTLLRDPIKNFLVETFTHTQQFPAHWERSGIPEGALSLTDGAVYVPLLIMGVYFVCLAGFISAKRERLRNGVLAVIFLLVLGEAFMYRQGSSPEAALVEGQNKELYSILSSDRSGRTVFFSSGMLPLSAMTYGIRLVEGYDPLMLDDYLKMLPPMYSQSPATWRALIVNNSLLSMMNVKYLIVDSIVGNYDDLKWYVVKASEGQRLLPFPPMAQKPPEADFVQIYRKIAYTSSSSLYENMIALPRAYSVANLLPIASVDQLMQMVFSYRMNPWQQAAVSEKDLPEIGSEQWSPGEVTVVKDEPARVALAARFKERGFVVLADEFYPGWEATIDGKQTKIWKTNGVMRGVVVPQGMHIVVFTYVPRLIYACTIVGAVMLVTVLFMLFRKDHQSPVRHSET